MGRDYKLTAVTPDQAGDVLDRLGAGGVVSAAEKDNYAYPHSRLLWGAAKGEGFTWSEWAFARGDGAVLIARRNLPVRPNLALIGGNRGSVNVGKMNAALR